MIGLRAGKAGVVGGSPFQRFNPALLSPVAWYRYNTGITSSGGTVSAWANQVSGGEALVQATAANQPVNGTPGANLAVNGTFDSDTGWTLPTDWTIGGGAANKAAGASNRYMSQSLLGAASGDIYLITFTVLNYVAGGVASRIQADGSTNFQGTTRSAAGTYTDVLEVTSGTTFTWGFLGFAAADLSIDNVSIQKITADGTIYFDGISHFLKTAPFTLNQPTTVYFLGRQVSWTLDEVFFDGNSNATGWLRQIVATPRLGIRAGANLNHASGLTLNEYGIVTSIFNSTDSLIQFNSDVPTTGNAGTGNMGGFTLGANAGGTQNSNIQCKEILIYNLAHDANQRAAVIAYLSMVNQL